MSKSKAIAKTMAQAQKIVGYHCKEVEEMALDVGKRMMQDQSEWLDAQMKDILPPHLYEAGKMGDSEREIAAYVAKHGIRIIFIPDRMVVRVMIKDRVHSQFVPSFTVDGEPVELHQKQNPLDGSKN